VRRFDPGPRPAESSARLADAEARLDELAVVARTHPVPEFLERLVEETALLPLFGFRPDGPVRVESLRLLVEAADSLADGGFDTLPAFVRWLREQDSDEGRSVFGELDPGTGAGVEVLTMHKAKGLEFPVVVLADLAGAPVSSAVTLCERATGRLEFRLPCAREGATPGWDEAWEREKLRRDAEEVRLLYVAMTRARDHLHLVQPLRMFVEKQHRHGDRHVYAPRSRFLPDAILDRFERVVRGRGAAAGDDAALPVTAVDVAAKLRAMW
jgi:ATP-dependent exoDNAse (exonuclease V) beta subunit